MYTLPRAFLEVKIDGRRTFFEWLAAGHYHCQNERGTMAMVSRGPLQELFFGFDIDNLFLRIDCDGPARIALHNFDSVRIVFTEPAGWEAVVEAPGRPNQMVALYQGDRVVEAPGLAAGTDLIAELAIPFNALGIKVGGGIQFFVDLHQGKQSRDRAPREGTISLVRPSPDFEQIMWDV
jgi:hypothetical protein